MNKINSLNTIIFLSSCISSNFLKYLESMLTGSKLGFETGCPKLAIIKLRVSYLIKGVSCQQDIQISIEMHGTIIVLVLAFTKK